MKKLAIIFAATASLAATALACPGHDGGKTAEKTEQPAPKAEQPAETAKKDAAPAAKEAAPAAKDTAKKADKVSSK